LPREGGGQVNYATASQQVSWLAVHDFVMPKLQLVGDWPMVGSPAWCQLDDRNRVKWAAALDAAQHWALRIETAQQASADAATAIATCGTDWAAVAKRSVIRTAYLEARPWMQRVVTR
jgi:hypothetical protein